MPQAGRAYPWTCYQDFGRQGNGVGFRIVPPRKLYMLNEGPASGVLGLLWEDLDLISDLGERVDDGPYIRWKFEQPGDPDSFVLVYGQPVGFDGSLPAPPLIRFIGEREFWYHGTRYGRGAVSRVGTSLFSERPGSWAGATGNWQSLADPSQFERMGDTTRIGSALWSDQPDYHPYRTRP